MHFPLRLSGRDTLALKEAMILFFISLALTLIPMLCWGKLFLVGGDDSKLYYLFPYEYFRNFTLSMISDNQLGSLGNYFPQFYVSGFSLFVLLAKVLFPFFNTQFFLFGLNLSLGFLFFYLLLGVWIKNESRHDFFLRIASSIFYAFSTFTIYSLWQSQLFSIYLIAIFPLAVYFFLRGVTEKRFDFIVYNALLISVFSIVFISAPWFFAAIIAFIPVLFVVFLRHKKTFALYTALLVGVILLLNVYWITHFFYSPFSSDQQQNVISNAVSSDFRKENRAVITGVTQHNSILYPVLNLFQEGIQKDFSWHTYPIYLKWSLPLIVMNLFFLSVLLLAVFHVREMPLEFRKVYVAAFASWLGVLFLFTVNIGAFGTEIFLWLNNFIPGFTMFRNMYDKFGLALALIFSLLLALSLKTIFQTLTLSSLKKNMLCLFVVLLAAANAYPFIRGYYFKTALWTTEDVYTSLHDFNDDFYALLRYLKEMKDPSRFLWYPWEDTNYVEVQDSSAPDHYYVGVSPVLFLANTKDLPGKLGMPPAIADRIVGGLEKGDVLSVVSEFRKLNAKYIIVKNDFSEKIGASYLYANLFKKQTTDLRTALLGEKIKDFGARYSLYRINDAYKNEKIYLTADPSLFPNDFTSLVYTKKSSFEYRIAIRNMKNDQHLIFLEPYHAQWELYSKKNERLVSGNHETVFQYANGWKLSTNAIKKSFPQGSYTENADGSLDLDLVLYFTPQKYVIQGVLISGVTLTFCLLYLVNRRLISGKKQKL